MEKAQTAIKDFDLSAFQLVNTAILEVENPKGDPLLFNGAPVTITLYGPGSKEYKNAKYKLENANQTRSIAMLRGKTSKTAAEDQEKANAEFLAACTAQVDNFPITGGALALYSNPGLVYITDQVNKFLGDAENFMPT
jgi:hypothetical protein